MYIVSVVFGLCIVFRLCGIVLVLLILCRLCVVGGNGHCARQVYVPRSGHEACHVFYVQIVQWRRL